MLGCAWLCLVMLRPAWPCLVLPTHVRLRRARRLFPDVSVSNFVPLVYYLSFRFPNRSILFCLPLILLGCFSFQLVKGHWLLFDFPHVPKGGRQKRPKAGLISQANHTKRQLRGLAWPSWAAACCTDRHLLYLDAALPDEAHRPRRGPTAP